MNRLAALRAGREQRISTPVTALFWRICLLNGVIFTLGTLVLAFSPATVSARLRLTEVPVLVIGLAVILTANAVALRTSLAPLNELVASMRRVDPPRRAARVDRPASGDFHQLIETFNAMLDRLESERSVAGGTALAAQEGERRRIARELHDEIGQSLTVALLRLKRVVDRAPTGLREEVEAAQETVRGCLDEVRGIASRLRPDVLEDLGLPSAITALCHEFTRSAGISVRREVDPALSRLDPDIELVCYRVAQESLTNVLRHAGADDVTLVIEPREDCVILQVTDNGRGGAVEDGAGIRGMRERAMLIDATLTITSPASGGTAVELVIPVAARREEVPA
ncbi:histidine kinase [Nocardia sp. AG03]|uniref:sensor histidine kinase n=1 Tax=Nocardia sp. AG03 TaxID=3025312 RepID=UPI00241887C5|nr:histidine kinase [Nocardia sp. AG03]